MKLLDIDIEQYNIWNNLKLTIPEDSGLAVIYGPNETGKTTLRRFVQDMLYGEEPREFNPDDFVTNHHSWRGRISFRHHREKYQLERSYDSRGKDYSSLKDHLQRALDLGFLREIQGQQSRDVYQSIFGVGLKELQELATLQGAEVSQRLYGTSLGPLGQRILNARTSAQDNLDDLFHAKGNGGKLFDLGKKKLLLQGQLAQDVDPKVRYLEIQKEIDQLQGNIKALTDRETGLKNELSGNEYIQRVWPTWKKERQLQADLAKIPGGKHITPRMLEKLDNFDLVLMELEEQRNQLKSQFQNLRERAAAETPPEHLWEHLGAMQTLVEQRGWLEDAERRLADLQADKNMQEIDLKDKVLQIGPQWNSIRLGKVDTSPDAHYRMVQAALKFQKAHTRRGRHRKRYRKISDVVHTEHNDLQERLKKLRVQSLDKSLQMVQQRIDRLEERSRLRQREDDLNQRKITISRQLDRLQTRMDLPWWAALMLWTLMVCGIFLFLAGVIRGVEDASFVGMIYSLVGIMCAGLAQGLRAHFDAGIRKQVELLQVELRDIDEESILLDKAITHLGNLQLPIVDMEKTTPELVALKSAHNYKAELQTLKTWNTKLLEQRKKLSEYRSRLPLYQREVNSSRQNWCELLRQLGLEETLKIQDAMHIWEKSHQAKQTANLLEQTQRQILDQRETIRAYRERVEKLALKFNQKLTGANQANELLKQWEVQVRQLTGLRKNKKRFGSEAKSLRKGLLKIWLKKRNMHGLRNRIFRLAEVDNREQLESVLAQLEQANKIKAKLLEVQEELRRFGEQAPPVAVTEQDLEQYNDRDTKQRIEFLKAELKALEQDKFQVHESLGRLRQNRETLLKDRRETELRYHLASTKGELKSGVEDYLATQLAYEGVREVQKKLERTAQSITLQDASRHFQRLSKGRYQNLWSPLGSMDLMVDDHLKQTLPVAYLSDGAREQLFLAVRLSMIDEMFRKGVELPVLMDDLMVNFDKERTTTAVETLIEFAKGGKQVLFFTCHEHVVELFAERGVPSINLGAQVKPERKLLAG